MKLDVFILDYEDLAPTYKVHVDQGYHWGCQCGESYRNQDEATNCKKCRIYLKAPPTEVYYTKGRN